MNYMTASIILDVNLTNVSSDLKKAEAEAKRAAKEVDRQAQRTMKAVEKAHKDMAKAADKAHAQAAKAATKAHKAACKKIDHAYKSLKRTISSAFSHIASAAKWMGVTVAAAFGFSAHAAMKQEDALFALIAALKNTGEYTKKLEEKFKSFAAQIQAVTKYGDEEILNQMAYAKNLGVSVGKLEDATKAAIGLATAYRIDLNSAMQLVGRASQGQTQMLTRYGIVLDAGLSSQEKFNRLLEIGAEKFSLAEEEAKTTSGTLKGLWNVISDVAEKIGGPFLSCIRDAANAIREWAKQNEERIAEWAENLAVKFDKVMDKAKDLYNVFKSKGFSEGLKIIGEEIVIFLSAVVDSFVIAGIAAGKAFWKAFMEGPKSLSIKELRERAKNLGVSGGASLKEMEKAVAPSLLKERIQEVKEEIKFVDLLVATWVNAGIVASKAIPSAEIKIKSVYDMPSDGGALQSTASINAAKMKSDAENEAYKMAETQRLQTVDEKLFEYQVANANLLTGIKIDNAERASAAELEAATNYINLLREQDDMSLEHKLENIQVAMDAVAEQYGVESTLYKKLADEQANYHRLNIKGFAATRLAVKAWVTESLNWGKKLGEVLNSAFTSAGDTLAEMLLTGADNWKSFVKSFIHQLVAMIAQLLIAVALQSVLTFGANITKGSASLSGFLANLAQMAAPKPSKQTGGYIERTGLYNMHQGEKVLTRSETSAASKTGVGKIELVNATGVPMTLEETEAIEEGLVRIMIKRAETDGPLRMALGLA